MIALNITISGDKEVIKKLKSIKGLLTDWRAELQQVGDYLMDFYQNQVFETEGGIFGERWSPLSPKYEFMKRKEFPGRGILQATGKLRKGYRLLVNSTSMEIVNRVPYGVFHQYGTRRLSRRILIKLDNPRKDKIADFFKVGLLKKVKKAL